jgi:hypothetical protein
MTQLLEAPAETGFDFDALIRATRPHPAARPKLSEAIRLGAKQTLPSVTIWEKVEGDTVWACAMGAACYVAAGNKTSGVHHAVDAICYFPQLSDWVTLTDELVPEYRRLFGLTDRDAPFTVRWMLVDHILVLNDQVHLSRERIADIVEALGY